MNKVSRLADILGAIFFLILAMYFIKKPKKTYLEILLMIGSIFGFILDLVFVYDYYRMIL